MRALLWAVGVSAALAAVSPAKANLVMNGMFDSPDYKRQLGERGDLGVSGWFNATDKIEIGNSLNVVPACSA